MAEETNEGVNYLKALRHYSKPEDGAGAGPAQGASHTSHEQARGVEKRRSPRYKCEGSAELREQDHEVRTWATFTDISLHGCYVEAQATYPVCTVLHMKLEALGVRFETKGKVRVNYPYLGMGIEFGEMSEENHGRLKELLGKISRPSMIMGPGVASSVPTCSPLDTLPEISDAGAAIQALVEFFTSRHMLTRDEFLRVLHQSQATRGRL